MKKLFVTLLACSLISIPVRAESTVNYQTYKDSITGRTIEYFDMGQHTTRNYVTQNSWFSDNKSFVFGTKDDQKLYKYDTTTHSAVQMFDDMQLMDNCAVVDPSTDTVYSKNNTTSFLLKQSLAQLNGTATQEKIVPLTLSLPLDDTSISGTVSDASGLTFKWANNDRWNDAMTVVRTKGDKTCRSTVARNTSNPRTGELWYDVYTWSDPPKSNLRSSFMTYTVDSSKLSADTSNVEIQFDYYDDGSDGAFNGQYVQLEYLATSGVKKEYIELKKDNSWKTGTIVLTDAKFDHRSSDGLGGADFRIGISGNRGGFASTWVKVSKVATDNASGQICFEVNDNATSASGTLALERWSPITWPKPGDNYARGILFSGEDGSSSYSAYASKASIDGKAFIYNVPKLDTTESDWKYWRNSFFFDIPDNFITTAGSNVEVLIDYYAPDKAGTVNLFVSASNGDTTEDSTKCFKYSRTVEKSNGWATLSFLIPKNVIFTNGWWSNDCQAYSNIKIMPQDLQLYIHKVSIRKYSNYDNLGYALGSWLPHISSNGDLSLITGNEKRVVIYEADKEKFASANVYANVTHGIINPKYPNLVLYNHEGTAEKENNRIWVLDRSQDGDSPLRRVNVFEQYANLSDGETTGEAIGHEDWSPDGELIVAVKYNKDTNVGKNGIVIMNKDGSNRRYINDDYSYLHCNISPDGKWIVADTEYVSNTTNIVLINIKTGKSYLVARPTLIDKEDVNKSQVADAHPTFNLDGTKITFGQKNPNSNILGIGMIDVSDIVNNDDQFGEYESTLGYQISPLSIGFDKDTGRNLASVNITNTDGKQRKMNMYTAVYDADGRLVSVGQDVYDSADNETLYARVGDVQVGETVKTFVWGDSIDPIQNTASAAKRLSVEKTGTGEVVLSWQGADGVSVNKYEVFRGNTKIGETPYTTYKDTGLTKNTKYTYYVRPIYTGLCFGEDGANITTAIDDANFGGIYAATGYEIEEHGLSFWNNIDNVNADSFTKWTQKDGEWCRAAIHIEPGDVVSTPSGDKTRTKSWASNGMFFFGCDEEAMRAKSNTFAVGVRYYDSDGINPDNKNLTLKYIKTDGTIAEVPIVQRAMDNKWKTASIVLNDIKFTGNSDWGGLDFVFMGGYSTFINRAWVVPVDANGNPISSGNGTSTVSGSKVGIKVTTAGDTITSTMKERLSDVLDDGLTFVWNDSDDTAYGYTEAKNTSGRSCRQLTSDSTSMFLFKVDKDIIPEDVSSIDVKVDYYNYNSNGGDINLYYTATDGTTKSKKIATPDSFSITADKSWKSKTISITDAKLIGGLYVGSDFYINGKSGTKISGVSVTRKSAPATSTHQYVEWNQSSTSSSGLTKLGGGSANGDYMYVNTGDWFKFDVADSYMYGKSENMATVEITYYDGDDGKICLYYNSSDPIANSAKADKKAGTVISCTGTGEEKTATISVIDANFTGMGGYDFVIRTEDAGVNIKNVRVVGY